MSYPIMSYPYTTIISHFYNEEFLLPLWLEHHKQFFEFGVMVDYNSTDRSVEIIKDICPHWQILPANTPHFDHKECDDLVMHVERQLPPPWFRISVTCTEFIVGDVHKLISADHQANQKTQWLLPVNVFTGYDPNGALSNKIPLWEQVKYGIPWQNVWPFPYYRSFHNYNDMAYSDGRHFHGECNQNDVMIFKYSNALIGKEMFKRRLQIADKVSQKDKDLGCAEHNVQTETTIENWYKKNIAPLNSVDLTEYIDRMTKPNLLHSTTFLFTNKPEKFEPIKKSAEPEVVKYFDGSNIGNFSKIINLCVESSKTETVILCSDKTLPTYKNIEKIRTLLDLGYGFVGLWKFGLFGLKKELFRKIGVFDERFIQGGYEDFDFLLRLQEANIAVYMSTEANYTIGSSSWNHDQAWDHWCKKWKINEEEKTVTRQLDELPHNYNFGPNVSTNFLEYSKSIISNDPLCDNVKNLCNKKIIKT